MSGRSLPDAQFTFEEVDRFFADIVFTADEFGVADQFVAEFEDGLFDDFVAGFVGQDGLGTADQGVEFVGVFHLGGNDEDVVTAQAVGEGFGDVEDAGAEADEA